MNVCLETFRTADGILADCDKPVAGLAVDPAGDRGLFPACTDHADLIEADIGWCVEHDDVIDRDVEWCTNVYNGVLYDTPCRRVPMFLQARAEIPGQLDVFGNEVTE